MRSESSIAHKYNSIQYAAFSAFLAACAGFAFAWLVERGNLRIKATSENPRHAADGLFSAGRC
jgi:ABC-type Fe3+ transport system permease subunit